MISHHRQSEISFGLLIGIGVSVIAAALSLTVTAGAQVLSFINQPACGCSPVALSKTLLVGGGAGLVFVGWVGVIALMLIRQTRVFIKELPVVGHAHGYHIIKDARAVAFTAGLLQPRMYISTTLLKHLSYSEQRAVIRHERFHQQRFDPLRIAITETINRTLRWLPGLSMLYRHWRLTRELAADASSSTAHQRQALGRSLIKLLEQPLIPTAVSAFSATEERVRQLVNPNYRIQRRQWVIPLVAAFIVLCGIVGLTVNLHPVAAQTTSHTVTCPLTRQCIAEQIQKRSIAPVYVVCSPFSPAGGCFIVER